MDAELARKAVDAADLLALRTALYQATGEEEIKRYAARSLLVQGMAVVAVEEQYREQLRERAVRFLVEEAEGFVPTVPSEPELKELIEFTLGCELSGDEFDLHRATPGFDEFPRAVEWSRGRPAIPEDFSVAVIGAGLSGIAVGVQLARLGIPFTLYERRSEVGGTWSINTYPDARVDTASSTYEYRFKKHHRWTEYFARQGEVRGYLESVAREFGVDAHIRFRNDVVAAEFDDASSVWVLTIGQADGTTVQATANVVISASGLFATPRPLEIEGVESFAGRILHTTEWDEHTSVTGQRVAVLGNGSTGVQLLARIAQDAHHVHVHQRTPQWISPRPRYGQPVEPEVQWLMDHMPYYWNWTRLTPLIAIFDVAPLLVPDAEWQRGGGYFNERNDAFRAGLTAYIRDQVGGREDLVERLTPDYPPMARRLIVDNGWYRALTRENVELVTDPITRIEPHAIVTADGRRREVDTILAAIGFSVTKYLWPTVYRGRAGARLEDAWRMDLGGPRAYAGMTVPDFPNLFIMYGPNSQPTTGGMALVAWMEIWASYAVQGVASMLENGYRRMEVRRSAFEGYNAAMDARAEGMIWSDPGSVKQNYYVNENGRLQTSNPWEGVEFFSYLKVPNPEHYDFS